jgi:hypothetical protein
VQLLQARKPQNQAGEEDQEIKIRFKEKERQQGCQEKEGEEI